MVMIICMLVMVRDFPYLILAIQKYITHIVRSLYLMSYMFLQSRNHCFLFRNFVSIIMFILSFTLFCFMSRISTPMKYSSQDRVKMVSTLCPCSGLPSRQFLKPIVIKPGPGVDPAKGPGPGFQGSTRVNSGQPGSTRINPEKLKKNKVLIFHMKKSM